MGFARQMLKKQKHQQTTHPGKPSLTPEPVNTPEAEITRKPLIPNRQ
jgi:hypothetical protein